MALTKGLGYQRVPQLKYKKITGFELHISAGHILAKNVTPFRSKNFECSWFHSLMAKSHSHPALKIIKFCCLAFSGIDGA